MDENILAGMGERIYESRKALKYTQEQIAEIAGITYQTISLCEKGQTELKAKSLAGIAHALDVSTDYLLNGERTEYDLRLLDERALGLTDRQFNYFKKAYLDFIELCRLGEIE